MIVDTKYKKNIDGLIVEIKYKIDYEERRYVVKYSGIENLVLELENKGMDPLMAFRYSNFISDDFKSKTNSSTHSSEIIKKVKSILKNKK